MSLLLSRKKTQSRTTHKDLAVEPDEANVVEEVVKDNLEIMLEIIMIIRNDALFAKSIYSSCPRLQHLLDQHPDLRPIFEDPSLVRINFEEVYKKAGGILPEDQPSWLAKTLTCIVRHPLFKVFRMLLLIKKCYSCVVGGGVAFVRSILCFMCTDGAAGEAAQGLLHADPDENKHHGDDGEYNNLEYEANKVALNNAADYMEDPNVQERVQTILHSDPDKIDELIEADPELRALRDSNPLCAELMSNPDTMKILVEPDNLRALADAPDLIQQDFANPDWLPPDVEQGEFDDGGTERIVQQSEEDGGLLEGYEQGDVTTRALSGMTVPDEGSGLLDGYEPALPDGKVAEGIEVLSDYEPGDVVLADYEPGDGEENDGFLDEYEQGDVDEAGEVPLDGYEPEPVEGDGDAKDANIDTEEVEGIEVADKQGTRAKAKSNKSKSQEADGKQGVGGTVLASLGAGLIDYIAASTLGMATGELIGNDGDFLATAEEKMMGGAEGEVDEVQAAGVVDETEALEEPAKSTLASNAAMISDIATGDDLAENVEGTMDTVEQANEKQVDATTTKSSTPESKQSGPEEAPRTGILGVAASYFDALKTEAKEYVAGTFLGDDIGELVVERMEEGRSDDKDGEELQNTASSATKSSSRSAPYEV